MEYGQNANRPPVYVRHQDLERYDAKESEYRSVCPTCRQGLLMVRRDHESFKLVAIDTCTRCAQTVVYEDEKIAGEPVQPLSDEEKARLRAWGIGQDQN